MFSNENASDIFFFVFNQTTFPFFMFSKTSLKDTLLLLNTNISEVSAQKKVGIFSIQAEVTKIKHFHVLISKI